MHLAILNIAMTHSPSTVRLRDVATAVGHEVTLLAATELVLAVKTGSLVAMRRGEPLPRVDVVIPRLSAAGDPFGLTALRHFERIGVYSPNPSGAIALSHDKFATSQALATAGLPIPPSVATSRPGDIPEALERLGAGPFVVKTTHGSQGIGTMFAPTLAAASAITETLLANRVPVLLQGYVPTERSADIRAFVVGSTVVAAMRRYARPGEFRSNLHRGALAERHNPTDAEASLAVAAAQTLGLSIAGVDLLPTNNGPVILEVNSSPGLSGIEAVTKVDVARSIVEATISLHRSGGRVPE